MIQEGKLLPILTPVVTRPVEEVPCMSNHQSHSFLDSIAVSVYVIIG